MARTVIGLCFALTVAQVVAAQEAARTGGWVVLPLDE